MSKSLRLNLLIVLLFAGTLACQAIVRTSDSVASSTIAALEEVPARDLSPSADTQADSDTALIPVTGLSTSEPDGDDVYPVTYELRELTPVPHGKTGVHSFELMLLKQINIERRKEGLPPLYFSPGLSRLARAHSKDMAEHDFFSHDTTDGLSFGERMKDGQQVYQHAAENLFAGNGPYNSPDAAFKAWMESDTHRDNMLDPVYRRVGIGYSFNPKSRYGGYFTADFMAP